MKDSIIYVIAFKGNQGSGYVDYNDDSCPEITQAMTFYSKDTAQKYADSIKKDWDGIEFTVTEVKRKEIIIKFGFTYDGETDFIRVLVPEDVSLKDVKKAIEETDAYLRNETEDGDGEYSDSIYAESGCCSGTLMDEVNARYKWEWEYIVEDFSFDVD